MAAIRVVARYDVLSAISMAASSISTAWMLSGTMPRSVIRSISRSAA
jgi:hypothetical protein